MRATGRKNLEADAHNPNLYHSLENLANNSPRAVHGPPNSVKDNRRQENLYEEIRQRTLKRQSHSELENLSISIHKKNEYIFVVANLWQSTRRLIFTSRQPVLLVQGVTFSFLETSVHVQPL